MSDDLPNPVREDVRHHVWECLLDIVTLVHYYEGLEEKHKRLRNLTRVALFSSASGEVALVLISVWPETQIFLGLVIGLCVIMEAWLDYPNKLAALQMTGNQCRRLKNEWESLWLKLNTGDLTSKTIRKKNEALRRELEDAVSWVRRADLKVDENLNQESYIKASKVLEDRFAQAHS